MITRNDNSLYLTGASRLAFFLLEQEAQPFKESSSPPLTLTSRDITNSPAGPFPAERMSREDVNGGERLDS